MNREGTTGTFTLREVEDTTGWIPRNEMIYTDAALIIHGILLYSGTVGSKGGSNRGLRGLNTSSLAPATVTSA